MGKITDKYSNYLISKTQADIQLKSLCYDIAMMGESRLRKLYSKLDSNTGLRLLVEEELSKRNITII